MSSVQICDVRKSFGNFEVLHGVTIPIEDGEFVVLVGPPAAASRPFAADAGGTGEHHLRGHDLDRRPRRANNVRKAKERALADGVPESYALVSAHDRTAERNGLLGQLRSS